MGFASRAARLLGQAVLVIRSSQIK